MRRPRSDPFDRAVRREQSLRERADAMSSGAGMMRLALWWYFSLGVAWSFVLAGHWLVLPEPRWLAVLHTVVLALIVSYALCMAMFLRSIQRRQPEWFETRAIQ